MGLPGANYLYLLATISVTFVAFSALLLVLRETVGGKMTSYDSYFALAVVQAGFLLPQLLAAIVYLIPLARVLQENRGQG